MLFHYDGFVDGWKDLAWSSRAIHVSAINQTKWYNRLFMLISLSISTSTSLTIQQIISLYHGLGGSQKDFCIQT